MGFINTCFTTVRRRNKDGFNIKVDNDVIFEYFDKYNNHISSTHMGISIPLDFSNYYFTLDKDDNIYGIYRDNALKMIEFDKNSNDFYQRDILTYNYKKFNILFPYIHVINGNMHILYYVFNNNSPNTCALFHHYNHNGVWIENRIDFINHIALDNFSVVFNQDSPMVFYFNLVDGYEEVFFSKFNISTFSWSNPLQITKTGKNKLYLSVLKDNMNFYHLTFCGNIDTGYIVKYMNGYLNDYKFQVNTLTSVSSPSICMFPTLLKYNSKLCLTWANFERLYSSVSSDCGITWSVPVIDELSVNENFTRSNFFSNCIEDLSYSSTGIFVTYDNVSILGI